MAIKEVRGTTPQDINYMNDNFRELYNKSSKPMINGLQGIINITQGKDISIYDMLILKFYVPKGVKVKSAKLNIFSMASFQKLMPLVQLAPTPKEGELHTHGAGYTPITINANMCFPTINGVQLGVCEAGTTKDFDFKSAVKIGDWNELRVVPQDFAKIEVCGIIELI